MGLPKIFGNVFFDSIKDFERCFQESLDEYWRKIEYEAGEMPTFQAFWE